MYFSNSKKSVKDYKWKIRECDERKVQLNNEERGKYVTSHPLFLTTRLTDTKAKQALVMKYDPKLIEISERIARLSKGKGIPIEDA